MASGTRDFDLILWGATGFTGSLVAEYLARAEGCGGTLRWAIAGRNTAKLQTLVRELASLVPGFDPATLPVLEASLDDAASLARLAASTRVLLSSVGPYALFGTPLVHACAEAGTDYCDLTGETQWIHQMIAEVDATARRTGARIVHCCGFDSVPFDMGVWFLQRTLAQRGASPAPVVRGVVRKLRGAFSGGTYASLLNAVGETAADPRLRRMSGDANSLLPPALGAPRARAELGMGFQETLGVWTAPFVMATINTKILRRSNALLGFPWGRDFRYEESMSTGRGFAGRARAWLVAGGLGAFMGMAAFGPTRSLLRRLLPAPGEGPDRKARESGFYEIDFLGETGVSPHLVATVGASLDPGYASTARMIAECALCLAQDAVPTPGGSWTPASCMAKPLLERLISRAGLRFSVREMA